MTHQNWATERLNFQQLIASHIAAGTCYLCGQPVGEEERRHGVTGAHYDCANGLPHPAVKLHQPGVSLARQPGDSLLHIVDRSSGTSRCSSSHPLPQSGHSTSWKWCEQSAARYETCPQCVNLSDEIPTRN